MDGIDRRMDAAITKKENIRSPYGTRGFRPLGLHSARLGFTLIPARDDIIPVSRLFLSSRQKKYIKSKDEKAALHLLLSPFGLGGRRGARGELGGLEYCIALQDGNGGGNRGEWEIKLYGGKVYITSEGASGGWRHTGDHYGGR
jgi:hypothetical protein